MTATSTPQSQGSRAREGSEPENYDSISTKARREAAIRRNAAALQLQQKKSSPTFAKANANDSSNRVSVAPLHDVPSPISSLPSISTHGQPVAKMFVICCSCQRWHDLPSKMYEAMALPKTIVRRDGIVRESLPGPNQGKQMSPKLEANGIQGKIFTDVKCPWCEHAMSTSCCAGWTTVIHLHERHH